MPDLDLFAFLDDASPWWWIALAIAIGAAEMLTFTYFLIWPALGALATGLLLWLAPGMNGTTQLAAFALFSAVLTIAGRYWLASRAATPSEAPGLNRRSETLIGRVGRALEDFENDEGVVIVDGVRWRARVTTGAARKDQSLSVIDAEGMTLICEPA